MLRVLTQEAIEQVSRRQASFVILAIIHIRLGGNRPHNARRLVDIIIDDEVVIWDFECVGDLANCTGVALGPLTIKLRLRGIAYTEAAAPLLEVWRQEKYRDHTWGELFYTHQHPAHQYPSPQSCLHREYPESV